MKLKVVAIDNTPSFLEKDNDKIKAQAIFERKWHDNPQQFDPSRNCLERNREEKTWNIIQKHLSGQNMQVADLGCGKGNFTIKLSGIGAFIDAVDIASQPLNDLRKKNLERVKLFQEYIPQTTLPTENYDLALGCELIAHLPYAQYRLFASELCRLIKKEGMILCSTPLDIYSDGPLERFLELMFTEFEAVEQVLSRHALYIKIVDFFKAPSRFLKGSQDPHYRKQWLASLQGMKKKWVKFNTSRGMKVFWTPFSFLLNPLVNVLEQWDGLLIFLEKLCKAIAPSTTVSHIIFVGKKRPLFREKEIPMPLERIQKQRKWE